MTQRGMSQGLGQMPDSGRDRQVRKGSRLVATLNKLDRFPVEKLADRALLRRVDTKFLYPAEELESLIQSLGEDYGLLPAGEHPIATYRTLYFDSPDKSFFHQHRRGQRDRFKIRIRHYLEREVSFLEVKRKTNHDVTVKARRKRDFLDSSINGEERSFLQDRTPCDPSQIVPQVWTNFHRITLVGLGIKERLTVDLGLEFEADFERHHMHGLAIIEVKQPRFWSRSPAMLALRARGIRPSGMSKYCTAQAALFPDLRCNRFRPSLRNIRRLTHV